jgi:Tfp pilus assembly protein PilX
VPSYAERGPALSIIILIILIIVALVLVGALATGRFR